MLQRLCWYFFSFLLLGFVVACSISATGKKSYVIACPSQWTSIPLFGQDKQVAGYLVDLMQEISKNQNIDIRVLLVPESDISSLVERKVISGYFSAMPRGFRAEKQYDLSSPFFASGFLLFVQKDSPKKSLEDSLNMNIGYTAGAASYLRSLTHPSWREYLYDTSYAALDDLMKGRIDGVMVESLDIKKLSQGYDSGSFRPLLPPIFMREIRLVAPKSFASKELIDDVAKGFLALEGKQVPKQLLEYWELVSLTSV